MAISSCDTSLYYSQDGATELSLCDVDREFGICILTQREHPNFQLNYWTETAIDFRASCEHQLKFFVINCTVQIGNCTNNVRLRQYDWQLTRKLAHINYLCFSLDFSLERCTKTHTDDLWFAFFLFYRTISLRCVIGFYANIWMGGWIGRKKWPSKLQVAKSRA